MLVGHHIIFYFQQAGLRSEMRELIRSNPSMEGQQLFVFSPNDKAAISKLEWDGDHEFRLDGKMYDVIEKKMENGKLIIRCISDERETALINKYEKLNQQSGNGSKNKTALLIKLMSSSYLAANSPDLPAEKKISFQQLPLKTNFHTTELSEVLTPPPQVS